MTAILGINAYHGDSAACLVVDGDLKAAAEEERFRRIKHWAGFPTEAVRYCVAAGGLGLQDISYVTVNTDPHSNFLRKIRYTLREHPQPRLVVDRIRNAKKKSSVIGELERAFPGDYFAGKLRQVDHHLAHLGSCFFPSPFFEAIAVSVDGFGDFASAAWGHGIANEVSVDGRVFFPDSLGIFYQALTQYLGFPNYGDEYKVMGLAPYGQPKYLDKMRQVVRLRGEGTFTLEQKFFRHAREKIDYRWDGSSPKVGTLFTSELEDLLGPARRREEDLTAYHRDIASSVQAMYEEAFFHLLETLHGKYKVDALALAGGCAMNSVANGKVTRRTRFKHVYIQSAAGDAGGALGAALALWYELERISPRHEMTHAFWGPEFSNKEIAERIREHSEALEGSDCQIRQIPDEDQLCREAATSVAKGKVVGWFQGRMEWGPRALGNRSIVCDPRRGDMKSILNAKIKKRESFRPFAPSILREAVREWFQVEDDVPFMMKVFPIREDKRQLVPAVTHVDGTGRLQTVTKEQNPRYYHLISAFHELTGVPMVLNTSFNENEPVVCSPQEALDCFLRTNMDVLIMGNWYLERSRENA